MAVDPSETDTRSPGRSLTGVSLELALDSEGGTSRQNLTPAIPRPETCAQSAAGSHFAVLR